jgi:hypothetical protein
MLPSALSKPFPETARFRPLLPGYIIEVTSAYPTSNGMVADFFRQDARQNDLVLCDPDFEDYPLDFYDGDKIKLCCQLGSNSPLPLDVVRQIDAPVSMQDNFPDWIVVFGTQPDASAILTYYSRPHLVDGVTVRHNYTFAKGMLVYYVQTQRPELPWHSFGPDQTFDWRKDAVYIFRAGPDMPV